MSFHDDLKRKLADAGLPAVAQSITQLARPCYRVVRALSPEEEIPLGASKFGGSPDVPADFVWPQTPDATKSEPMEFVGQVRLADLPGPLPEPAPQSGLLSFFTRWSGGRVFYFPEGTLLQRTAGTVRSSRTCTIRLLADSSLRAQTIRRIRVIPIEPPR